MAEENNATSSLIAVGTRIPSDLHAEFSELCERERRSMSARILMLIEEFVASQKQPTGE